MAKAMRVAGKSGSQLADELGVHRNTINNYLHGRSTPDRRTLMAWAMACGVPLEWLERGEWAPWDSNPQPTDYEHWPDGVAAGDAA